MGAKVNNLEELRRKKSLLKAEVKDLEHLITFDNAKESLSAFTNGFTDPFLKEVEGSDGEVKTTLNNDAVIQKVREEIKEKVFNKNAVLGMAETATKSGLADDALKLGVAALVGNFAKRNMNSQSWQKRIIGLLMIYLLPSAIRFFRNWFEKYQKNKSISSMEQLI